MTIFTSGDEMTRTGLTVSSMVVVEGEPGLVQAVVGPTTDLWDLVEESGRFVVHVCAADDRDLAQVFAGLRPSPGGVFAGVDVAQSDWGPVLQRLGNRAFCTFLDKRESGYSGLVTGRIDRVAISNLTDPLVYFRGNFHGLR